MPQAVNGTAPAKRARLRPTRLLASHGAVLLGGSGPVIGRLKPVVFDAGARSLIGRARSTMVRVLPAFLAVACLSIPAPARAAQFWSRLDRDGPLSAGWVQVLPALSAACNFRIDSSKLNYTLIDLSTKAGNRDYTADLYETLYQIDQRRARNRFVELWNTSFHGDQAAACATAERLWGSAGSQFAGVLVRDASNDATSSVNGPRPNNCQ